MAPKLQVGGQKNVKLYFTSSKVWFTIGRYDSLTQSLVLGPF